MRFGHGKQADQLLEQLAEDISQNPAFKNIAVFSIDDQTTFTRGLDTQRLDGYGITKAHVTTAKSHLAKINVKLTFDEVDELLHHAIAHHDGNCDCEDYTAKTAAQRMQAKRERDRAAGHCARGGASHAPATRGTICEACYVYGLSRKKATRAAKKLVA